MTIPTASFDIDPAHSRIGFVARHAMVTKVRGSFHEFSGRGTFVADDPSASTLQVTIEAGSIETGNADRDGHLRGNDFFAMDEHPQITFASTAVTSTGDDNYDVTGDLTMKGVSKPLTIPFEVAGPVVDPMGNTRIGLEGRVVVNRKDWGVNWNAAMEAGGLLVSDNVTLEFDIAAVQSAN